MLFYLRYYSRHFFSVLWVVLRSPFGSLIPQLSWPLMTFIALFPVQKLLYKTYLSHNFRKCHHLSHLLYLLLTDYLQLTTDTTTETKVATNWRCRRRLQSVGCFVQHATAEFAAATTGKSAITASRTATVSASPTSSWSVVGSFFID